MKRRVFEFFFPRWLLRLLFGNAFADPKFPVVVLWKCVFFQKILGFNRDVKWPVHRLSQFKAPGRIKRGNRMPGLSPGCYLDGRNGIEIGENTWIGPGVKIISMNHDLTDYFQFTETDPIRIGQDCWLGANAVVLPGVTLGDHTIVAAGAVVSKSFPEGNQLLGGVPAKVIKPIPPYKASPDKSKVHDKPETPESDLTSQRHDENPTEKRA